MNGRLTGVLVAAAALFAAGLSTGARIYYLLAAALLAILLLGLAAVVWTILTVHVTLKGVKPRVTRGDSLMTVFTVRHASLLPVAEIRVCLGSLSPGAAAQEISVRTPPLTERTFRHTIACPHRGVFEAGVTRVSARDLFGLVRLSRNPGMKKVSVEVLPRLNETEPMELRASDMGPEFRATASDDTASPSDVRAWQDGDSLKKVHWKLSMRRREIMVRTYEESARPDTLVIPDLSEITALKDQQLNAEDRICECCLAAANAQLSAGYPVRMPLLSARPSEIAGQFPADSAAFADALMRASFDSPYAYEKVLALMLARMQRTGGAVLVTARLTAKCADVALRMQRSGIRTKFIWVTDEPREESLALLERLKMENVLVECVDPWRDERAAR